MERCSILLVDDDAEDRAIISDALKLIRETIDIHYAADGKAALELLFNESKFENVPDLIVLDMNMPRMNGVKTLTQLKNNDKFKHVPVIIYSTSINPFEKERCLSLGAHSYITKPVSYKESMKIAEMFLAICS